MTPDVKRYAPASRARAGKRRRRLCLLLLVAFLLLITACQEEERPRLAQPDLPEMPGGAAERGAELIEVYGCGACHTIPGIRSATAKVGPPLDAWAQRHYIAGSLRNTPDNLIFWIMNPQEVEPGTAMPDMGVDEDDARDIGAYLYTLEEGWP